MKMKNKKLTLIIVLIISFYQYNFAGIIAKVVNLRIETKENPIGIDMFQPRFSWQLSSELLNISQQAYQIMVASTAANLKAEKNLVWNTGKVSDSKSIFIPYTGSKLNAKQYYYWKVKVWTNKGESAWSDVASWSMSFTENPLSKAKWIGMDSTLNSGNLTTKTRLSARYLRKEFRLKKSLKSAHLYISGLGMYECYINGKKISNDIFAPTLSDYTKRVYYNVYDVKSFLAKNQNAIGVILGNGRFFSMRMDGLPNAESLDIPAITNYGFPKLLLQLELEYKNGQKELIVSDESWKINTNGPIIANNEFDGEEYDARLELTGWEKIGYSETNWKKAQHVNAPEGKLVAQFNPNILTMKTIKPISINKIEDKKYVVDMGQNMVGWIKVNLKATAGKPIRFHFAEFLNSDGSLYVANLRGSKSTNIYTPLNDSSFSWKPRFVYHGFRYVEISGIDYSPSLSDITGEVNYDQMSQSGTFESSDSTLNHIYRNANWGILGNYRGMPTDCPQRDERMGWLGDRATGCFGESFMFDNQLLYRKWVQDINDSQLETGSIPDVVPTYWKFYSDNITWPAAYISIVEMLYQQFGDTKPIQLHYESMKKWMNYMRLNYMKDYIITKDTYGDWCMPPEDLKLIHSIDPKRKTNGELLSTSFYYRLLHTMAIFATTQGKTQDADEFKLLAAKVKDAYNAKFFQPNTAQYDNNTVTANLISLMQGLVPAGYEQAVFENSYKTIENEYNSHVSVGLIGIQFLMRGLTKYGRADLAYKIATNRTYPSWGYMIDNGATTIWELWNGNTADPSMNSGNHVMLLGDLMSWYYEDLAGISTEKSEPGFKKIVMKPNFVKGLNFVKASHNSPYGVIKSEWKREDNKLTWDIIIPANTSAIVQFPATSISQIKHFNTDIHSLEGVKIIKQTRQHLQIEIPSGNYHFILSEQ